LAAFIFLDFGIVNTYTHLTGDSTHVLVELPYVVVAPVALVLAVAGIQYFFQGYSDAVERLPVGEDDTDVAQFERIIPFRVKLLVYGGAVVVSYVNIIVNVGLGSIAEFGGTPSLINRLFVWQVGYFPFVVEFGLLYFGIHVLLPQRLGCGSVLSSPKTLESRVTDTARICRIRKMGVKRCPRSGQVGRCSGTSRASTVLCNK